MKIQNNLPLAPLTSFKTGGAAKNAIVYDEISDLDAAQDLLADITNKPQPVWFLGYGSNSLVSDKGLDGTTIIQRAGRITQDGTTLICDAGVWWDDLVTYAINRGLWGLEFTSAVPGNVGAAVVGNIAAYGQAVKDTLLWAEVLNAQTGEFRRYSPDELGLEYRISHTLQEHRELLVLRAAFGLSLEPTAKLEYDSAKQIALEKKYDLSTLIGRRQTIIDAREKAGSLWDFRDEKATKTAGSFFRNPLVNTEVAERVMSFDETGKSLELLRKMNQVHGGDSSRVSAAQVLLAAGYKRGQTWGSVRLHKDHVLKIENAGGASSQDIYNVAQEIISTVRAKLDIELDPEIRFLGDFS